MTRREIEIIFGSGRKVAKFFKITKGAVYKWEPNEKIPEKRELQLKDFLNQQSAIQSV